MSQSLLVRPRVRLAVSLRALSRCTKGVAAVEFALIAPIMAALFMGSVELSQAITANRRVTQVGTSTGDLVARADKNITDSEIIDIMKVGSYLMSPYSLAGLSVDVRVVASSATDATDTKLKWTCSYKASNPANVTCTCPSTSYAIPAGLVSKNDAVVISDIVYDYKPTLFDYFMKKYYAGGAGGVYKMKETVYQKPRSNAPQLQVGATPACGVT
jgi:Flp pilus assembly protein TadG